MHYPRVRRKGLGPKGLGIYISLLLPLTCKAKQMSVVYFSDKHSLSMSCPVYKACLSAQITMPSSLTNFHHIITNIIRHLFGMKLLHWQHEYLSVLPKEELTDNSKQSIKINYMQNLCCILRITSKIADSDCNVTRDFVCTVWFFFQIQSAMILLAPLDSLSIYS